MVQSRGRGARGFRELATQPGGERGRACAPQRGRPGRLPERRRLPQVLALSQVEANPALTVARCRRAGPAGVVACGARGGRPRRVSGDAAGPAGGQPVAPGDVRGAGLRADPVHCAVGPVRSSPMSRSRESMDRRRAPDGQCWLDSGTVAVAGDGADRRLPCCRVPACRGEGRLVQGARSTVAQPGQAAAGGVRALRAAGSPGVDTDLSGA
jgi:hypothetical protein